MCFGENDLIVRDFVTIQMSKGAKVIQKRQGFIDLKRFGTRRNLEIDYAELHTFMSTVSARSLPSDKPLDPSMALLVGSSPVDPSKPYMGPNLEYVWDASSVFPPVIEGICEQVRAVFSLKREVKGFIVRVFPPALKVSHKESTTLPRIPMEMAMQIGSRIVLPIGSSEIFELFVSAGKGQTGTGKLRLSDGEGVMTPLGLAAGADFTWNDGGYGTIEPTQPGSRPISFKKSPLRRYVFVIDCINDTSVLVQAVKDEAALAAKGSASEAAKIEAQMLKALDLHDVDSIAAVAAAKTFTPDHPHTALAPEDTPVKSTGEPTPPEEPTPESK